MKVQSNISSLWSSKLLRCWTMKPLWGGTNPAIQQSILFSRKYREYVVTPFYIKLFGKFAGLLDCWIANFAVSSPIPTPCLILTSTPHGSGGAKVQGTVNTVYCGSASRPRFEDFSLNLGPVILQAARLLGHRGRA